MMATAEQILSVLTGTKIFNGSTWTSYDKDGNLLVDFSGVLWRGAHGALLWNANYISEEYIKRNYGGGGGRPEKGVKPYLDYEDDYEQRLRQQILDEDEILVMAVANLIVNGAFA